MIQREKEKNHIELNEYAQILMQSLPNHQRFERDEKPYVGTCARLVREELKKFYAPSGKKPPTSNVVKRWFYTNSCPDWAIALLHFSLTSKNLLKQA